MDWSVFIISLLTAGTRMAIPIAYAGIGVVLIEKAGVLNIGCESQMLIGAFISFYVTYTTKSILLGILSGAVAGMLFAAIVAYLCISRRQDQSVVGIVFNIFTVGLTSFLYRALFGTTAASPSVDKLSQIAIPGLSKIPYVGDIFFNQTILFYILIVIAFALWFAMFKLKIGLKMRAVGENPRAAQAAGIDVIRYRYVVLMIGGALAGIGGAYLSCGIMGQFTENMSAGRGFIALAVTALSRWNPILALVSSYVFGIADALQLRLQAFGVEIPYQFMLMLPYILTLVSLVIIGRGVRAPKSLGVVFKKEGR